jgi:hypothetical protein
MARYATRVTEWRTNRPASLIDTAGAEQYIPRAATERVLARLEAALDAGDRFIVLSGPPGLGKTLLLHVLEERQRAERKVIFSPFLHFPPDEARVWLRGLLRDNGIAAAGEGVPTPSSLSEAPERPLLLILDEAQSMPPETAAVLAGMLSGLARRTSILLAGIEGPRLDRVVRRIREPAEHVRLGSRFSPDDAREFVDRAMRSEADGSIGSPGCSEAEAGAYHAAAEGNPRILKALIYRAELGEPPPALGIESSEARVGFDEPGEDPLALDAAAESEPATVGIARSTTTPVEPEARVAHDIGARSGANGFLSGSSEPREIPESGSARTPRHTSIRPRWLERSGRAAWNASKRAFEGTRRLELVIAAISLGVGLLVARLVVPTAAPPTPPTSLAPPGVSSASPVEVILPPLEQIVPPLEQIVPVAAEPAAGPSAPVVPSLDQGPAEEAPAAAAVASAVTLHINARPWASIRLDGEAIGSTPLSHPETRPGRYELEAEFPDGRIVKRVVEVGADSARIRARLV